ncbi:mannosyl-oligosaccharide 1,2-alpha-mannosidase Ecym_5170 [Eremothecium cymbalariae DBVPG|uniref:alpha-1,2-Mannosidase n=1 Tax=Eremothecium cymbalariae (strain CBS 270.75 / DBVPG 7215 / KCTC 17166 / NRRL Y-17582) TaxID=931890 RepID=I6ND02_ERECY|nr:hypothetical protein Ecym_5170 [Eremothecium cymbalariae DBVPG\
MDNVLKEYSLITNQKIKLSLMFPIRVSNLLRYFIVISSLFILVQLYTQIHQFTKGNTTFGNREAKTAIEHVFMESWDDYIKHAWGFDVFHVVQGTGSNMADNGKPLGWMIVDALDTMMIIYSGTDDPETKQKFRDYIMKSQNWIQNVLDYDIDIEVNVFETTIRMLGGLLSAYYLSSELSIGDPSIYLTKAISLGDRLVPAFADSPIGIPYSSINLHSGEVIKDHGNSGASTTAEITTLQLEFKYLSYITGNDTYWRLAEAVYKPVFEANDYPESWDGLVPVGVNADTGMFWGRTIRLGSRGDSYYEYLLKQYLLTHETLYRDIFDIAMEGVSKHLLFASVPNNLLFIAAKENGLNGLPSSKMDHLLCFIGSMYAMRATDGLTYQVASRQKWWDTNRINYWNLAEGLTETCYMMYHEVPSGLAPEIAVFRTNTRLTNRYWWESPGGDFFIKPNDGHNLQRPETVESIMYMSKLSEDNKYKEWAWEIFENFRANSSLLRDNGAITYTCLKSVTQEKPYIPIDNMESFWLAETLKYLYLTFHPAFDLKKIVFNTEAHPFPVMDPVKLQSMNLDTGWSLHHN